MKKELEVNDFVVDRTNESGSGHQEIAVYFPDGYKIRFWKAGLTDAEYIKRAKLIRENESGLNSHYAQSMR
jgi:hypothetical protein